MVTKGNDRQQTFTINMGKRELYLDIFPPKTAERRAVTNKETWTVDLKPVNPMHWMPGRSAATRLTALARSEGTCERCGENPGDQVHHKNRMKTTRTMLAKGRADRDQREQALALCKECHREVHHGNFNGEANTVGWNAGCAETCLSGVGSAGWKPPAETQQGAVLRLQWQRGHPAAAGRAVTGCAGTPALFLRSACPTPGGACRVRDAFALAAQVITVAQQLHWSDWERYSGRQETRMKLGGIVGTVRYRGPCAAFLPYMRLGEYIHVGKNTAFGLGQMAVQAAPSPPESGAA
jgi:hypothetical protein